MPTQPELEDALSTDHLRHDLEGRSVRGGIATFGSQAAQFITNSISSVVLARMLTPADFGLVAMVAAVTQLAQGFADLGLSEATIQREEISHEQVSALFWVNAGIGLALMLITAALGPVLAWFYREPRLRDITWVMSLTFLICGLRVQHDALLKRQMRFQALAVRDIASCILAVTAGVTMAWKGAGYWAIVALPLIFNLIQMVLSWFTAKWIPGLPRRTAEVGSLIAFGGKVATSYLVYNLIKSVDIILIGRYCGAVPLGLYSRAYNLVLLPVRQLSAPLGNVLVPAFSRLQNDPERFARYYLRAANLIVWIGAPVLGYLFVAAEPVIAVVLGARWQEAAPVFQILSISALGQLLLGFTIWLMVSRGQSSRLLKLHLIISPIIIASFVVGLPFGIKGVALSGSLVLLAIFPWMLKFTFHGTLLTLRRLAQAISCPILLTFGGILMAELVRRLIAPQGRVSQLLVTAAGFAAAFLLSALIPRVREEMMSFRTLSRFLGMNRPDPATI